MKNIIILILVLVFIGIVFLFDLPAYNKFTSLNKEIKWQEQLLEDKEAVIVKTNQLKQDYDTYKDELKRVTYVLPSEKEIPNLIVQFEALVSENGLVLESLNFLEEEAKKAKEGETPAPYKSLQVSLSATGTYESLESFLKALELNIRLMDVKLVDFSSKQSEMEGLFTFNINLIVYYQ